ncbi:flavin-containing monooxygenase [Magnetovibrio blakemorei]|uniref:Trimethylamine monooxygenase n=1 Tax=Magnetovibrio blakemorei TaxID=28181 RepID=A0A1E5QBJ3_9PROT|nr:NAD(P)-binding domain-containing protein [Magnetovibrio blakemorei]OEJ69008.1 monooxygenase [Magnetovibrio blakemorei]
MNKPLGKIAIIGGGPTGIGVGRELIEAGFEIDVYEAESDFGGVWNAEASCGRTYRSLHLISPKFNTQVPYFPMPDDYPVYPSHKQMLDYIRSYAKAYGLYDRAIFNAPIKSLTPEGDQWRLVTESGQEALYPLVVVCTGLQRVPTYGDYPGYFSGQVLHACDYKSAQQLVDKRVLVIGGGNSGCDIAADLVHSASEVYHSTRRGYYYQPKFIDGKPTPQWLMQLGNKFDTKEETLAYVQEVFRLAGFDGDDYGLPHPDYPLDGAHSVMNSQILYYIGHGNIVPKGDVASFAGNRVRFVDNSEVEVDVVLHATGYKRDFPFLADDLLEWKKGIPDLFLHAAPRNHDNLLFMGFINTSAGLGDGLKTQGLFVRNYARALFEHLPGLERFLAAKKVDTPDLGQSYFVDSYRHLWEADLWKLLGHSRHYREMLVEGAPEDEEKARA